MRGSSAKHFVISLDVPSIVTDIKTPKWEGETVKLIKIIKDPLIVLESYIYVCVPIWWNFFNFLYLLNSTGVFNINLMGCFIKIFKYPFNSYWKLRYCFVYPNHKNIYIYRMSSHNYRRFQSWFEGV